MRRTRVVLRTTDPLIRAGLTEYLDARSDLELLADEYPNPDVVVLVVEQMTPGAVAELRRGALPQDVPILLVVDDVAEADLRTAVECGIRAVIALGGAARDDLARGLASAVSRRDLASAELLTALTDDLAGLRRAVMITSAADPEGLSQRELDVLRLLADGFSTAEIAAKLCYSERTVKSILHGLTRRRNLRSRTHAVAYALRAGLI